LETDTEQKYVMLQHKFNTHEADINYTNDQTTTGHKSWDLLTLTWDHLPNSVWAIVGTLCTKS